MLLIIYLSDHLFTYLSITVILILLIDLATLIMMIIIIVYIGPVSKDY